MKNKFAQKSKNELEKELSEKKATVRNIRFGTAGSRSKNVKEQKMVKKNIARILTILKQIN